MKRICILIISLLITVLSFAQPSITEVYLPKYVQGFGQWDPAQDHKVPYVCRLTIDNLTPNATYRYFCRFVDDPDPNNGYDGDGNFIRMNQPGNFERIEDPTMLGGYAQFTANASGSYTGWFMAEVNYFGIFSPGTTLWFRVMLNNGAGGFTVADRPTAASPLTVIDFGATSGDGTALRSTAATNGIDKNIVVLWDNTAGAGQPVAATIIETDGLDNGVADGFASFYANDVDGISKTWGTIIPNLGGGIKKIAQYNFTDGAEVGSHVSASGQWAKAGGGLLNTGGSSGGLINVLVLDGAVVTLGAPVKQNQAITFNNLPATTYGDADFEPDATASSNLAVTYTSSDPAVAAIINDTLIHLTGAGTATITANQAGDADYNAAPPQTRTLTVNKAELSIQADTVIWLQGTPMPALTLTYIGFTNGDDSDDLDPKPQVHTTANSSSQPGEYAITVDGAASPNYNISYKPGVLKIVSNKQAQIISFDPLPAKVYGDADFNPGASVNSPLAVSYSSSDTNIASIVNSKIHIKRTGTTTITASQPGNINYEPAQDMSRVLTINKAPLIIKADTITRLYGFPNPPLTVTYSGFVNGENNTHLLVQPVVSTTATAGSQPGNYPITVSGAASDNYAISYVNAVLTIEPLPTQTISFQPLPVKKYGDANFSAGAKASSGLRVSYSSGNANVATILSDSIIHLTGAGTTTITASQPGDATHAAAPDLTQILTVQKATLTIKANDQKKNEGAPNPVFTLTYTGFVNGDDSSDLSSLPVVNTTATAASLAGTYTIDNQGAASPNYTIHHQNGILTVLPPQGEGQDNMYAYISSPGQLQVNVYAANTAKVSVQVFDLNGARLVNTAVTLTKGFNTFRIPVGNLSSGIYNVRVAGNGVMLKTKIVIREN